MKVQTEAEEHEKKITTKEKQNVCLATKIVPVFFYLSVLYYFIIIIIFCVNVTSLAVVHFSISRRTINFSSLS